MKTGVTLQGVDRPDEFEKMAAEIESLGYDNLWLTDSSLHSRYCWAYLTLAARVTSRLRLGTAVTNPVTRHPAMTAIAASTLAEISDGRVILGIGAGDRPLLSLGYSPARVGALEASIASIRALWTGEHVTADGLVDAHYRFPPREDIPVYISASGPRTLELAGRVADGVILLAGLHPDGVSYALRHIDRGAEKAGRDSRPHVTVFAYGAIDEDEEKAIAIARTIAAWFPQTAPVYCQLAGLSQEIIDQVRSGYEGGEFQEAAKAAEALPVDFVKRMALAGGRAEAAAHVSTLKGLGVDSVTVFPLGPDRMATVRAFAEVTGTCSLYRAGPSSPSTTRTPFTSAGTWSSTATASPPSAPAGTTRRRTMR
jgi:5,10-methylenetetrahydromethanopterin reductase